MTALGVILIAALCLGAAVLVYKLFWPNRAVAPDADDSWAQHNEQRTPSLERAAGAADNAVDAAVAVQDMGIH
jgi:nucleoside permease NupC